MCVWTLTRAILYLFLPSSWDLRLVLSLAVCRYIRHYIYILKVLRCYRDLYRTCQRVFHGDPAALSGKSYDALMNVCVCVSNFSSQNQVKRRVHEKPGNYWPRNNKQGDCNIIAGSHFLWWYNYIASLAVSLCIYWSSFSWWKKLVRQGSSWGRVSCRLFRQQIILTVSERERELAEGHYSLLSKWHHMTEGLGFTVILFPAGLKIRQETVLGPLERPSSKPEKWPSCTTQHWRASSYLCTDVGPIFNYQSSGYQNPTCVFNLLHINFTRKRKSFS